MNASFDIMVSKAELFIDAMLKYYGNDAHIHIQKFTDTIEPKLRNALLLRSITQKGAQISFTLTESDRFDFVKIVKLIRDSHPGMTLKEAKDIADQSQVGWVTYQCSNKTHETSIQMLISYGAMVKSVDRKLDQLDDVIAD